MSIMGESVKWGHSSCICLLDKCQVDVIINNIVIKINHFTHRMNGYDSYAANHYISYLS